MVEGEERNKRYEKVQKSIELLNCKTQSLMYGVHYSRFCKFDFYFDNKSIEECDN